MEENGGITQITSTVFTKNGTLTPPRTFQKLGFTWQISLELACRHNVPSIDMRVECLDLRDEQFLSTEVTFENLDGPLRQHSFWHVFDQERCKFCYRRAATGIRSLREDGATIVSFPISQFLRSQEMGEKHDADEKIVWPINVAMTWNVLDDGKVEAEPVKNCYFRFEYRIILKHIITLNARPNRLHLPSWPKSNRFPVQLEYFEPLWPGIRHFLENMHEQKISSQDCWNYCDMLGALYHQWKFDESKLLELESLSYKLGFSRFFDGIGLEGDFFKMTQSTRTANIQRRSGKRVKMKNRRGKIEHKVVWELHLQRIRKDAQCIFKIFNGYQITVNFFSSTFRHTEYLSIGIALQGDVTHTEFVEMEFIFRFGNLETQDVTTRVRRRLDPVQNTICVPTVCTIEEIEKRLDTAENDVFLVEVHLEICSGECLEENKENILEMPGKNDVVLKFDEKKIAVNRDFLGHHVQFFRTLFFNENFDEHRRKILEISTAAYTEMVQFLDTLYHGTKSFKVCQFYHVLRMADEWICEKVVGIVEKALINCQIASVNKRKLAEKFNLMQLFKILQNNNKTGEVKKMRIL